MHRAVPRPAAVRRAWPMVPLLALALAGCAPAPRDARDADRSASPTPTPIAASTSPVKAAPSVADGATGSRPDAGPADDAAGTVDAKSPAAAAAVVTRYFDALAAGNDAAADAYWRDAGLAAEFRRRHAELGRPAVTVDAPAGAEGAAGSIYVTVPVRFAPTSAPANSRERHGEVVMRRANDIPGATAEQRRWRIERIDVAMTPK